MSSNRPIPSAWDDDFETSTKPQTSTSSSSSSQPAPEPRVSRAQRRAQHAAANRALWNSAENPETFHFLEAQQQRRDAGTGGVALPPTNEFKPQLKVLSRKPQPNGSTNNLNRPLNSLTLASRPAGAAADDEPDSEEEERTAAEHALRQRQEQAKLEREEKQRRYQEVRERLFGPAQPSPSPTSSPHAPSPLNSPGRNSPTRGARGGGAGASGNRRGGTRRDGAASRDMSRQNSSAEQSPARAPVAHGKLYDPSYVPRPSPGGDGQQQSRQQHSRSGSAATPMATASVERPIRMPKGPDASGRGFAPRGRGRTGLT